MTLNKLKKIQFTETETNLCWKHTCHLNNHEINSFFFLCIFYCSSTVQFVLAQSANCRRTKCDKLLDNFSYTVRNYVLLSSVLATSPVLDVTYVCEINRSINSNNNNSVVYVCLRILFDVSVNSSSGETSQYSCKLQHSNRRCALSRETKITKHYTSSINNTQIYSSSEDRKALTYVRICWFMDDECERSTNLQFELRYSEYNCELYTSATPIKVVSRSWLQSLYSALSRIT